MGWRVTVTVTSSPSYTTEIWLACALFAVDLTISPREYLDQHPDAAADLASLEQRRDWRRMIRSASERVVARLLSHERVYSALYSPVGLRRCIVEALHCALAGVQIPLPWAQAPEQYIERCERQYTAAVEELLATAHYDSLDAGTVAGSDAPRPRTTRLVR